MEEKMMEKNTFEKNHFFRFSPMLAWTALIFGSRMGGDTIVPGIDCRRSAHALVEFTRFWRSK